MFLLDSRSLLWILDNNASTIPPVAQNILKNSDELFVSMASLWKIAEKMSQGKLTAPFEPSEFARICAARSIQLLPVTPSELDAVRRLPPLHADVFDRMVVATAQTHGYTVITANPAIRQYDVATLF